MKLKTANVMKFLCFNLALITFSILSSTSCVVGQTVTATASVKLAGLKDRVTVRRDDRGIPYIAAENDEDLYFAQGYVTASDRLWQMDLLRRSARGELAEVLGTNALDEDKRHRIFGFAQTADTEAALASPKARAVLQAYADGVNAYISSLNAKTLPPEFQILQYSPRPWTPSDSLIIVKIFFEALSSSWRLDVMREALADLSPEKRAALLPEQSPLDVLVIGNDVSRPGKLQKETNHNDSGFSADLLSALLKDESIEARSLARVGLYAEGLAASNNWVVSGKHTASGKPLLANDPHLSPTAPSIWYLVHLTVPGMRVAGVTAPGLPGVVIGHNENIVWGFTNVGPDVQDLYIEKFDPQHPNQYMTPDGWRDAEIRHETIKVRKGFSDTATDSVNLDVTVTRNGPIILEKDGKRYALRWTALDPKLNRDISYSLNRARNWNEFTTALQSYTAPVQNIVYADTAGHIGYYAAGIVPIRKSGDGSLPYDGATDDGQWTGYVPFEKLPHVLDPPSGIIVTANQRIVGTSYPYFLTHSWAMPYRARRIYTLLAKNERLTSDDFRAVQADVYSIAGKTFSEQAVKILPPDQLRDPADASLRNSLLSLQKWNGQLTVDDSVGPIASQMRIAFRTRILRAALGEDRAKSFGWSNFDTTIDRLLVDQPKDWLPQEFSSYGALLRACYDDARQALTKMLGSDESKWTWGNMVKARFPHPLSVVPLIGAQFTIPPFPQNGTAFLLGATVNVGAPVSMRLIADPSDWDKTQQGIALGESGLPSSPHWQDQLNDWKAVTTKTFPFTEAAIGKATQITTVLEPAH